MSTHPNHLPKQVGLYGILKPIKKSLLKTIQVPIYEHNM